MDKYDHSDTEQAWRNGAEIQVKSQGSKPEWIDVDEPAFAPDHEYRVKPKKGDTLAAYGVSITSVTINEKGEISAKNIEPESFYVSTIKE